MTRIQINKSIVNMLFYIRFFQCLILWIVSLSVLTCFAPLVTFVILKLRWSVDGHVHGLNVH